MAWQEFIALGIVATTAVIFLWRSVNARRRVVKSHSACGCFSTNPDGPKPPSMILRGRKGERPRMMVKLK